jgi:hypothetical protein
VSREMSRMRVPVPLGRWSSRPRLRAPEPAPHRMEVAGVSALAFERSATPSERRYTDFPESGKVSC